MTCANLALIFFPILFPMPTPSTKSSSATSMDQFKPSERELHYIAFIIKNYKEIFKPNYTLVKKIEQIEAQQRPSGPSKESLAFPQSKSMPVSIKPRNTPKKAAKLLGLDLEQVSASPINLKTVQTPNLQDIKIISTSRVKLQRRVRNRPTIMTIEQQLKNQERAREKFDFSDDSGGSPSKKQKDYDKLVDKLNLEEGASPMSEYQHSLSSEDLSSRKLTTSVELNETPKVGTPEVYIREKQRQREVLCAATKRNLPQKIHKSRKEHFHNHAMKIDIPNVPKFNSKNQYNEYNLDNDSTSSSAYCTESSRTASLQKSSSTEVLEEDTRSRGRSHDSGTVNHRPKSKEIQRRNSGRRQRPVVKTANKCTVDRGRAVSDGRKETQGLQTPPSRQMKKVQPVDFTITPYKPATPRPGIGTAYLAPSRYQRVVRRNSSNTSSERGRTTAIHRKSSSGKRNERPAVVTRSNSKRMQRHTNLVEPKHIRHEVRHANKISTATHNKETTV